MAYLEAQSAKRGLVISPNAALIAELEPLLEPHMHGGLLKRLTAYPSPSKLAEAAGGDAQILFLDMSSDGPRALELLQESVRLGGQSRVVALLAGNDPDLMLRCLRSGAAEFLIRPFTPDQMEAAFGKLARLQSAGEVPNTATAKIFAVMPAKGACGATTIASHLALQWQKATGGRVLLADLDALTGNLSFILKTKSIYSFLDTLHRAHELDHDLWGAMVTRVNGIDLLLAPDFMPDGAQDLTDPTPILEYARHAYDVVILDASGVYGDWNLNMARLATEVLLITTNELPALQAAQRALSYLDTNRIGRWKVRLIVNRYLLDVGLSREVIATALHTEVFDALPSDYDTVQKALMDGKPIPPNSAFGKAIMQLVGRLGGKVDSSRLDEPSKKSLSGLFGGLFSKTK